jgi:hypothetical protein
MWIELLPCYDAVNTYLDGRCSRQWSGLLKEPNKQNCEALIYMPAQAGLMSSNGARRQQQQQDLYMKE